MGLVSSKTEQVAVFPYTQKFLLKRSMKNNLMQPKGNLALLKCWDSKTPEEETPPITFDFFLICITILTSTQMLLSSSVLQYTVSVKILTVFGQDEKKPPSNSSYLFKKEDKCCYLNTYIFLNDRSRKKVHTINQLLKGKTEIKSVPQNLSAVTPEVD